MPSLLKVALSLCFSKCVCEMRINPGRHFLNSFYSSAHSKLSGKGSASYPGKHFLAVVAYLNWRHNFWTYSSGCKLWNCTHFGNPTPLFNFVWPAKMLKLKHNKGVQGEMFQGISTRIVECTLACIGDSSLLVTNLSSFCYIAETVATPFYDIITENMTIYCLFFLYVEIVTINSLGESQGVCQQLNLFKDH